MSAYVVTGTDSGIGKTGFAAALAAALGAHYWKPALAGQLCDADLATPIGLSAEPILPETYPAAHRAAEFDGVNIDPDRLVLPDQRPLVIDAKGGALTPLTREVTWADVFAQWGLLTIIAARTTPGSINHSLLTIEALRARRVPIHGIAFIGEADEDIEATITAMGRVRRLGRLPRPPWPTPPLPVAAFADGFRIDDFA